jgi:hypothetical protein
MIEKSREIGPPDIPLGSTICRHCKKTTPRQSLTPSHPLVPEMSCDHTTPTPPGPRRDAINRDTTTSGLAEKVPMSLGLRHRYWD